MRCTLETFCDALVINLNGNKWDVWHHQYTKKTSHFHQCFSAYFEMKTIQQRARKKKKYEKEKKIHQSIEIRKMRRNRVVRWIEILTKFWNIFFLLLLFFFLHLDENSFSNPICFFQFISTHISNFVFFPYLFSLRMYVFEFFFSYIQTIFGWIEPLRLLKIQKFSPAYPIFFFFCCCYLELFFHSFSFLPRNFTSLPYNCQPKKICMEKSIVLNALYILNLVCVSVSVHKYWKSIEHKIIIDRLFDC